MPDISMCMNSTCERAEYCYRYTATPSEWQSYSRFSCCDESDPQNDVFMPNEKAQVFNILADKSS